MNFYTINEGLVQLEMNQDQTDFLWFLDQCGLDQHVRTLRHTDVFYQMRQILMNNRTQDEARLESDIHSSFLLDRWLYDTQFGHCAAQRFYQRFWQRFMTCTAKSNFIDVKLRKIEAGSAPIHAAIELSLPKKVTDVGGKQALFLMLQLPDRVLESFTSWAQDLCFIDYLLDMKPDYQLLLDLQTELHQQFESLYKRELRQLNKQLYYSQSTNEKRTFYEKLFKYSYPVKRDIFRCLCESELNAGRC